MERLYLIPQILDGQTVAKYERTCLACRGYTRRDAQEASFQEAQEISQSKRE
jgi:hypothetical protein